MAADNPIADLAELIARMLPAADTTDTQELRVELRLGEVDMPGEGWHITVAAKRVILHLETPGFEIEPRSRHGEPSRTEPVIIAKSSAKSSKVTLNGSLSGKLTSSLKAVTGIGGDVSKSHIKNEDEQGTEEVARFLVTARPNNKWEVAEPLSNQPLKTTPLNDDVLCRLKRTKGANRCCAIVRVFVFPKDLHIVPLWQDDGTPRKMPIAKEKLIGAVVSKSLNRRLRTKQPGDPILVSQAEIEDVD